MRTTPQEPPTTDIALGPAIKPPAPTAQPRATDTPGVMRGADGRVFTNTPAPWVYVAPVVHVDDESND